MCEANIEAATQAALQLLDRPDRPTAIFASNDVIAAGIMKASRRLGLHLPEELAVVGVDDSRICNMLEPELSSVHISCYQMGAVSVDLLYALLDGKTDLPRTTVIPTELIVRRSS
jgi:DNA-binding LacI/PurR family transcriptional regulator